MQFVNSIDPAELRATALLFFLENPFQVVWLSTAFLSDQLYHVSFRCSRLRR